MGARWRGWWTLPLAGRLRRSLPHDASGLIATACASRLPSGSPTRATRPAFESRYPQPRPQQNAKAKRNRSPRKNQPTEMSWHKRPSGAGGKARWEPGGAGGNCAPRCIMREHPPEPTGERRALPPAPPGTLIDRTTPQPSTPTLDSSCPRPRSARAAARAQRRRRGSSGVPVDDRVRDRVRPVPRRTSDRRGRPAIRSH